LKIGGIFNTTGIDSNPKVAQRVSEYFQEINRAGGVDGRKVKYIWFDYGGRIPEAVTKSKLLARMQCSLVIIYNCGKHSMARIEEYLSGKNIQTYWVGDEWGLD